MKKFLLAVLLAVIGFGASASDTTGKALSVRTSVKSFLQNEGFTPKIDSDGDIAFKYQGSPYYIRFENWRNQVYVTVFSQLDSEGASVSRLRLAADEAQRDYKFVRLNVNSNNVSVQVNMAAHSSSDITPLLMTYLSIISDAKQEFKDLYNQE